MKVLILARHRSPDQNGLLIFAEAKRQKHKVTLGNVNWPPKRIFDESRKVDWVFITGTRSVPIETIRKIPAKVFIWDADAIDPIRERYWNALKGNEVKP